MEDILAELVAFSIIGVGIFVVGILWKIVSSVFGTDDRADDMHDAEKEQHENSKKH